MLHSLNHFNFKITMIQMTKLKQSVNKLNLQLPQALQSSIGSAHCLAVQSQLYCFSDLSLYSHNALESHNTLPTQHQAADRQGLWLTWEHSAASRYFTQELRPKTELKVSIFITQLTMCVCNTAATKTLLYATFVYLHWTPHQYVFLDSKPIKRGMTC